MAAPRERARLVVDALDGLEGASDVPVLPCERRRQRRRLVAAIACPRRRARDVHGQVDLLVCERQGRGEAEVERRALARVPAERMERLGRRRRIIHLEEAESVVHLYRSERGPQRDERPVRLEHDRPVVAAGGCDLRPERDDHRRRNTRGFRCEREREVRERRLCGQKLDPEEL